MKTKLPNTPENRRRAKQVSMELWQWLTDNPMAGKRDAPTYLLRKIEKDVSLCPLCSLFAVLIGEAYPTHDLEHSCRGCPLYEDGEMCLSPLSLYRSWLASPDPGKRRYYARRIFLAIRDWLPEEERSGLGLKTGQQKELFGPQ